jgi:uncharacterized membrane protein YcaP (DUF421 family)
MFGLEVPGWELVLRAAFFYFLTLVAFRLLGKREFAEMTPFDLALLLLLSESMSNAIQADQSSVLGGAIAAATLFIANWLVGLASTHFRRVEHVIEGRPKFLIRNGRVDYKAMRDQDISPAELLAALREKDCFTPHQAEYAVLETSGAITVRRKDKSP